MAIIHSTFNSYAIVAAGAGKHCKTWARSASSKCGSSDVLEAFGVKIDLEPS